MKEIWLVVPTTVLLALAAGVLGLSRFPGQQAYELVTEVGEGSGPAACGHAARGGSWAGAPWRGPGHGLARTMRHLAHGVRYRGGGGPPPPGGGGPPHDHATPLPGSGPPRQM
jgi:hypothetical protein